MEDTFFNRKVSLQMIFSRLEETATCDLKKLASIHRGLFFAEFGIYFISICETVYKKIKKSELLSKKF